MSVLRISNRNQCRFFKETMRRTQEIIEVQAGKPR
ncbi:Protein of unknown function [Bacillus wiedmannii]|nr:Protein of unknown function [Bacillus wiedmannii]